MKPKVAPRPSFHIYFSKVPTNYKLSENLTVSLLKLDPSFQKYHKYENSATKEIDMKSNTVRAI